jgi:hypothetical protein
VSDHPDDLLPAVTVEEAMPLHSLSWATGHAISRLVGDPTVALIAAQYAEQARVRLVLDNACVVAAMMFAQPLLQASPPSASEWKFAYTVAVALGTKFVSEGFFLCDILDHWTRDFSLDMLQRGEQFGIEIFSWAETAPRMLSFRAALANVALQQSPPPLPLPNHAQQLNLAEEDATRPHVLLIENSPDAGTLLSGLILQLNPGARIRGCRRSATASSRRWP